MIAVRLPDEMERNLSLYAQRMQLTKTDVVREALRLYMAQHADEALSPYALGEELFGRYGSGDTDRSATYKQRLKEKLRAKQRAHR
jgi:predicted DNA-binding protein